MPKKFTTADKNEWLKLYEQSKSEKYIAREHARCDPRTVKKGIDEARRARDARDATIELVKGALQNHHKSLLKVLEEIKSALQMPPSNVEVPWKQDDSSLTVQLPVAKFSYVSEQKKEVSFQHKGSLIYELLKEHMKRDKMWRHLHQWKTAMAEHIHARVMLKRRAAVLLEEKTGLKLFDRPPEQGPYLLSYVAISVAYDAALTATLGIPGREISDSDIVAYPEQSEVAYRSSNSPIARSAPGEVESCREKILEAIAELKTSDEAKEIAATYKKLEESTRRAERAVEETLMLGFLLGQCRVCRRLGA